MARSRGPDRMGICHLNGCYYPIEGEIPVGTHGLVPPGHHGWGMKTK